MTSQSHKSWYLWCLLWLIWHDENGWVSEWGSRSEERDRNSKIWGKRIGIRNRNKELTWNRRICVCKKGRNVRRHTNTCTESSQAFASANAISAEHSSMLACVCVHNVDKQLKRKLNGEIFFRIKIFRYVNESKAVVFCFHSLSFSPCHCLSFSLALTFVNVQSVDGIYPFSSKKRRDGPSNILNNPHGLLHNNPHLILFLFSP